MLFDWHRKVFLKKVEWESCTQFNRWKSLFHAVIWPLGGDSCSNERSEEAFDVTSTQNKPGEAVGTQVQRDQQLPYVKLEKERSLFTMNTALKHWKEAATLILAAGHRRGPDRWSPTTPVTAAPGSPHLTHNPRFDYDILMLQRSSKSGFMPNAYVFPGGVVDSSDFSSEWLDMFKQLVDPPHFGLRNVSQHLETRPPIFATDRVKLGSPIPGEVAFRICALRETFEESGVLLVVSHQEKPRLSPSMKDTCASHPLLDNEVKIPSTELSKWRTLVNKNPSNFIRMCKELQVLPNIWALHEWSNWLTPVGRYGVSRFDTLFFICCLKEIPHTQHDEKEIVKYQVINPIRSIHTLAIAMRSTGLLCETYVYCGLG